MSITINPNSHLYSLHQNPHTGFIIILLILFIILSLNFVGESTQPFFNDGTSYALNILPSGDLLRWYILIGLFLSSSILCGRYSLAYGSSSLLYLPCSKLSFMSSLLEARSSIIKASSFRSFIFSHNVTAEAPAKRR